jgi:hypothetical protein
MPNGADWQSSVPIITWVVGRYSAYQMAIEYTLCQRQNTTRYTRYFSGIPAKPGKTSMRKTTFDNA